MEEKMRPFYPSLSEEYIQKNAEHLELLQSFCLLDDDFMTKVFEDKACAQLLLHVILGRDDLEVLNAQPQYEMKNLQGRSVRLDIWAVDKDGKQYDIEIQQNNGGAISRRARYNSSVMDAYMLKPGEDHKDLRDTYVIFITCQDVFKENLPIYHIERTIEETGKPFEDGSHIVYVNASCKSDTALGRLMHDFACTNADDMHHTVLAERVRHFKEDKEGIFVMCEKMEKLVLKKQAETLIEFMFEEGYPLEKIIEKTGLTEAQILQIKAKLDQQ